MTARFFPFILLLSVALTTAAARSAEPALEIYWIDVEGGGGTLIVTPAKEAIVIDTGWPWGPSARSMLRQRATP